MSPVFHRYRCEGSFIINRHDFESHQTPDRVTMRDVEQAAVACGFHPWMMDDRMIIGFASHSTLVTIETLDIPLVVFNTQMRAPLPLTSIDALARLAATWNLERINPAVYWQVDPQGWVWVHIRSAIPVATGLTEQQLVAGIRTAVELAMIASNHLVEHFSELDVAELSADVRVWADQLRLGPPGVGVSGWAHGLSLDAPGRGALHPARAAEDLRWITYTPPGDPALAPGPVTVDDVVECLDELGISNVGTHDQAVGTAINDIPFGFILDNGPSLMIRGMWLAQRDPDRDFLHTELLCNDFTASSPMAKVFVSPDDSGLQVAVEAVTEIPAGMTLRQLSHCLAGGINEVLRTLDELTVEATGESAVRWG